MCNPKNQWESLGPECAAPLDQVLVRRGEDWIPSLSDPDLLRSMGLGEPHPLPGNPGRFGLQAVIARRGKGDRFHPARPLLRILCSKETPYYPKHLLQRGLHRRQLKKWLAPALAVRWPGGRVVEWQEEEGKIVVLIDLSERTVKAREDSTGALLLDPPVKQSLPEFCLECSQLPACQARVLDSSPAAWWFELGLIDEAGQPTRRGRLFSFFQHGEGLAVAAGLETQEYPVEEMLYDLANVRAGHRFAGLDSPYGGRLGGICQQIYQRRTVPGLLIFGVPETYGNGASEVLRELQDRPGARARFLTEELKTGDIERALLEWKSLLRVIAAAPDLEWERWRELKQRAAEMVERRPPLPELPPLSPRQLRPVDHRLKLRP